MELVRERVEGRAHDGPNSSPRAPPNFPRVPKALVEEQAEDGIFGKVRKLAEEEMEGSESLVRDGDVKDVEDLPQEPGRKRPAESARGQIENEQPPRQREASPEQKGTFSGSGIIQASSWELPW